MFTPLFDRVLVKRVEAEEKTPSGLYIPSEFKEKPAEGIVLSIGEKCSFVKKDDLVVFGKYSGTEVKVGGEKYLVMKEDEILGIRHN